MVDNGPNMGESRIEDIRTEFIGTVRELATHIDIEKAGYAEAQDRVAEVWTRIKEQGLVKDSDAPEWGELLWRQVAADPDFHADTLGRYIFRTPVLLQDKEFSRVDVNTESADDIVVHAMTFFYGDENTELSDVDNLRYSNWECDLGLGVLKFRRGEAIPEEVAAERDDPELALIAFDEMLSVLRESRLNGNLVELMVLPRHFSDG